jgi:hypothetical protein
MGTETWTWLSGTRNTCTRILAMEKAASRSKQASRSMLQRPRISSLWCPILNGDGIPDIGVLASDTLEIFLGEGSATYATPFSIGTGPSPGSILVENLHGQSPKAGLPDIVVPDTSGGVIVLLNLTP